MSESSPSTPIASGKRLAAPDVEEATFSKLSCNRASPKSQGPPLKRDFALHLEDRPALLSSWDSLPPEILRKIMVELGPESAHQTRQTCSWWRQNQDAALLSLAPPCLALGLIIDKFPSLQKLDTCGATGRSWPALDSHDSLVGVRKNLTQLTLLHNLTDLSLGGAGSVTFMGSSMGVDCAVLAELAKGLTKLKRLSLAGCLLIRPTSLLPCLKPLVHLQELDMSGCNQLRDTGLVVIAASVPSIRSLTVDGCTKITDVGLRSLAELKDLDTLNTSGCILVRGSVHYMLTSLTSIDLSDCPSFSSASELVPIIPKLRSLNLARCRSISNNSISHAMPLLTNLTSLNLNGCSSITMVGLPVPSALRSLTDLDIGNCAMMSHNTLELVAKSMPRLRRLVLINNSWVRDQLLEPLMDLPLEHLDLRGSRHRITEAGVLRLVQGKAGATLKELYMQVFGFGDESSRIVAGTLRRLENLVLSDATKLTRGGTWQMLSMMSSSVKHLALEPANPLTDDCLEALVASMPRLESLRLSDCCLLTQVQPLTQLLQLTSLTVTRIRAVKEDTWGAWGPMPALRHWHVDDCQRVQLESLYCLPERLPRLTSLKLAWCRAIGTPSIKHISRSRTLKALDLTGTEITNSSLQIMAEMMLQHISLASCPQISPQYRTTIDAGSVGLRQLLHWMGTGPFRR